MVRGAAGVLPEVLTKEEDPSARGEDSRGIFAQLYSMNAYQHTNGVKLVYSSTRPFIQKAGVHKATQPISAHYDDPTRLTSSVIFLTVMVCLYTLCTSDGCASL